MPGLQIPAGTARIRLQLVSRTSTRPALTHGPARGRPGAHDRQHARARRGSARTAISAAVFPIPDCPLDPAERPASLCLTADDSSTGAARRCRPVPAWRRRPSAGMPLAGRIAIWYLPPAGARAQLPLAQAGAILDRAALFRPGSVGPWLYVLILLIAAPGLALASVRCLALARGGGDACARLAAWLFAIAALNFACWALITPPFQAPDEVDHFAYTQSLVERGEAPSRRSRLAAAALVERGEPRAGRHELLHRPPGRRHARRRGCRASSDTTARRSHASIRAAADGGGNETAADARPDLLRGAGARLPARARARRSRS